MTRVLRIGVAGLGRAFTLMLPTFLTDERVQLVAATDPWATACKQFERDVGIPCDASFEALCTNPTVEVVYIASPHQFHAEQAVLALGAGKHVWVEKPMAVTLAQCNAMVEAAKRSGKCLMVGHSHSFDAPILQTARLIQSGQFGAVRMLHAIQYTDFLYRARRPEELQTERGGGVIFSQGAHQVDVCRLLCAGLVTQVQAHCGAWDPSRPTEGAYSALLRFDGGAFASLTYSGYGLWDSNAWMDQVSELGQDLKSSPASGARQQYLQRRHEPDAEAKEASLKAQRNYGGEAWSSEQNNRAVPHHQHFGPVMVSCDLADLRPTPSGVWVHAIHETYKVEIPPPIIARVEVIDELYAAVVSGEPLLHSGEWARATLEVSLALLEASKTQASVNAFDYQVAPHLPFGKPQS